MVSEHRCRLTVQAHLQKISPIVMSERASWGAVPRAVVSKVLWSDDLGLLDRLRCQKVCQTWKSLLGEPPSAFERTDLSTDLCVEFYQSTTGRQHISLHLKEDPPAIRVLTQEAPFAWPQGRVPGFSACCQWLMLQAPLIRKMQLSNADMCSPALVRQMVLALTGASPQTPPAIAITTPSGITLTKGHVISHLDLRAHA